MKFALTRTSGWSKKEKPYSKAYPGHFKSGSFSWFVDIEKLEDLLDIIRETESQLVVNEDRIEIYDDYRE